MIACERAGPPRPLANAAKPGLACTTIEEVFALDTNEIDLGTAFLLADRELDAAIDMRACIDRLDELARAFMARCEPGEPIEDTLRHLVDTASRAPRSGHAIEYEYTQSLLSRVIEQGRGSCVSLSALYLAIAERAGLELHGVLLPNHFKVRHEGDVGIHEIETTNERISRGRDDRFLRFFSERDRVSSRFGETLPARDSLANYVAEIGHRLHDAGSSARGLELCRLAIAAWPELESAHLLIGNIESDIDAKSGRGIAAYQRALEIRPDDAYVWLKLGHAYLRAGSCSSALAPCSRAIELDPDLAPAWLRLAQVHLCQRRLEDALATCRSARAVSLDRIHPQDVIAINAMRGTYRGFEAEVYRTESAICVDLARVLSGQTPIDMSREEAMSRTERWLALSDLCKALATPELFPLETGRWAHRSATDSMSSNAQLGADPELIDLAAKASAHLDALGST